MQKKDLKVVSNQSSTIMFDKCAKQNSFAWVEIQACELKKLCGAQTNTNG